MLIRTVWNLKRIPKKCALEEKVLIQLMGALVEQKLNNFIIDFCLQSHLNG
ncbi:hypothetical protein [Lysinibacillus sp. RC79]|uniref:hypothetical protein n=1 Tax=Lysinibacillus sp. RC79 TaxID=3156296 RepID=UPI003514A2BD